MITCFETSSDQKITTVVAFPVPTYTFGEDETVFGDPAFRDFQLLVDGQPLGFRTEVRAYVGQRDVTALLARERVDAASFGHSNEKEHDYGALVHDFQRASAAAQGRLISAGAFEKDGTPAWRVEKKYYWTQSFPAHGTVRVEHSYSPVLGGTNSVRYGLEAEAAKAPRDADTKYVVKEIESLCLEPSVKTSLLKLASRNDMEVPFNYVDFILTTANTWKRPIEDFTLIIDRPAAERSLTTKAPLNPRKNQALVSFCWSGPVERPDADHFTAHLTNFVPTKELRVGFIYLTQTDPGS